jgi:DNA-binding MarR family transcriptional regulator
VLERLESRGLIIRTTRISDRRTKRLRLTRAGKALLSKAFPAVERSQEQFLTVLSPEKRTQFMALLGELVEGGIDVDATLSA